eukprot:scaffold23961_cov131-Isochrysis_galbana.AAC.6
MPIRRNERWIAPAARSESAATSPTVTTGASTVAGIRAPPPSLAPWTGATPSLVMAPAAGRAVGGWAAGRGTAGVCSSPAAEDRMGQCRTTIMVGRCSTLGERRAARYRDASSESRAGCHEGRHDAHRPHVGRARVGLAPALLGRHVQWRAALSLGDILRAHAHLGNPKVAELDVAFRREEAVGRLDVTVQKLEDVVTMGERRAELKCILGGRCLRKEGPRALTLGDGARQVAAVCIVHADAQRLALDERVDVTHEMRMIQLLQHNYFVAGGALLQKVPAEPPLV